MECLQNGETNEELSVDPHSMSVGRLSLVVNSGRCVVLIETSDDNCANMAS